jgi:hypothetical protein
MAVSTGLEVRAKELAERIYVTSYDLEV